MTTALSNEAAQAFHTILRIRKHPAVQSLQAERKVLGRLHVNDYLTVIEALEGYENVQTK